MHCPNCNREVAIFVEIGGRNKLRNGLCPYCGQKVVLNHSLLRVAILLPLAVLVSALLWDYVPRVVLAAILAAALYLGTVRLEKAKNV